MYTTSESKTYLYNNTCYLEYPKNIVKNESTKICDCLYYKYNVDDNNCICYSKEEKCLDKIHIIELKICLDDIKGCKDKKYKIFNNDCYFQECPNNIKIDNDNEYMCQCIDYYYTFISNSTLNCFEDSISCEMKNIHLEILLLMKVMIPLMTAFIKEIHIISIILVIKLIALSEYIFIFNYFYFNYKDIKFIFSLFLY